MASLIFRMRSSLGLRDRVGNGHCRYGLALAPVVVGCGDRDEFDRNHVTCGDRFDAEELKTRLADQGLQPRRDAESFHVRDPDGLDVQVGDKGLGLSTGIVENGFKLR
jgi:hypothetical protein